MTAAQCFVNTVKAVGRDMDIIKTNYSSKMVTVFWRDSSKGDIQRHHIFEQNLWLYEVAGDYDQNLAEKSCFGKPNECQRDSVLCHTARKSHKSTDSSALVSGLLTTLIVIPWITMNGVQLRKTPAAFTQHQGRTSSQEYQGGV